MKTSTPKVKVVYPQHKVRGATQHDQTLDGMFLPVPSSTLGKRKSAPSSSDPNLASSGIEDGSGDGGSGDGGAGSPSFAQVDGAPATPTIRQPTATARIVESECFLQSVLDLRADILKRRHGGAYARFLLAGPLPRFTATLRIASPDFY